MLFVLTVINKQGFRIKPQQIVCSLHASGQSSQYAVQSKLRLLWLSSNYVKSADLTLVETEVRGHGTSLRDQLKESCVGTLLTGFKCKPQLELGLNASIDSRSKLEVVAILNHANKWSQIEFLFRFVLIFNYYFKHADSGAMPFDLKL